LGHAIISKVMILMNTFFGKYEVFDGLYNSLLCVIKVKENSTSITYPKRCFSWPILSKGVQKSWI
jgi:hypothetical protein